MPAAIAVKTCRNKVVRAIGATVNTGLKVFSRAVQQPDLPHCESVSRRKTAGVICPDGQTTVVAAEFLIPRGAQPVLSN